MSIRQFASAAATIMVAIVVALAVPTSQLRTRDVVTTCCCPDPSHCHCPDHKGDPSQDASMRACHKEAHEVIAPQLPVFAAPELAIVRGPDRVEVAVAPPIAAPHPAPAPRRPAAPS